MKYVQVKYPDNHKPYIMPMLHFMAKYRMKYPEAVKACQNKFMMTVSGGIIELELIER